MEDEFALDEGLDADPEQGVEVDRVATHTPSATVPFRSGMEVEFVLDEGLDADPKRGISIGFYIVEDGNLVANIIFLQYSNNELNQVRVNFRTDRWKNAGVISPKSPFNVGKIGRVRLEYSGGLFQGVIWDKDRQRNKTWSERAPTEGQGNLTIFARIPVREKYSSIIYWSHHLPSCSFTSIGH
ncbi:uncharacterized protein LOC143040628 [Oratosquilla oratoria]|uniref:uncharacterized protein LOC143040628 n=1 Tax=Oratosquilla oratoria TaxID=337810 RepID=UPI003F7693C2